MRSLRLWSAAVLCAFVGTASAQTKFVTIKGRITLPAAPKPKEVDITADKDHCLAKGPVLDDSVIVNPKNQGLKNAFVYLRPDDTTKDKFDAADIHPTLANPKAKTHTLDQPCCMFVPRVLAMREGDLLTVKNSSPKPHNVKIDADAPSPSLNQLVVSKGELAIEKPFFAQRGLVSFACNIHPWMGGKMMVFNHPYFAVTDDDGKFEIKLAPEGKLRIMYRHENGYHKGRDGAKGFQIQPKADDKGEFAIPELSFEFPPVVPSK